MRRAVWQRYVGLSLAWAASWLGLSAAGQAASPREAAREVNRLLAEEMSTGTFTPAGPADDATFLRRVFLDLIGEPPAPDDVLAFLWNKDSDKREQVVQLLLADEAYGRNWGAYWRDVILYRRSEERALIVSQPLTEFLTQGLNANTSWDKLATAFITADGDVTENGATALIMAQNGQPEDTVAEISRIFLGIQIQCAQCHDHPTDSWKREQFHELVAFFPRVAVRPNRDGDKRSFLVDANDSPVAFRNPNANNRFRGTPEHYMPDLEDPQARGTLMKPVFFVTGEQLPLGVKDNERRGKLAEWVTSPQNPWFAKAFVNRLWAELCGEGFYSPVDDLGPEREPLAPRTLEYLAGEFTESGYDVKRLIETIMLTDMYQRAGRSRRSPEGVPFEANVIQPLRGEQLYNSLLSALALPEPASSATRGAYGIMRSPRLQFVNAFGFDPSTRRDEISGTISQAQALMNSPALAQAINAQRGPLAALLRDYPENHAALDQLYLRTLSRLPTSEETRLGLGHLRSASSRGEGLEDLQWALVNSAEFAHRP